MKTLDTIAGKLYAVMSPNGGTVTSADGLVSEEVEAGKQVFIVGTGAPLQLNDDAGRIIATFNLAPAKLRLLGLLGGGVSSTGLPSGYLAAEFLEANGSQYIKTGFIPDNNSGISYTTETNDEIDFVGVGCRNSSNTETRFYAPRGNTKNNYGYGWGGWRTFLGSGGGFKTRAELNYKNSRFASIEQDSATLETLSFTPLFPLYIFATNIAGNASLKARCKIWNVSLTQGVDVVYAFIPALDKTGTPCFFDKVSREPFYNSGTGKFIVGMTLAQARKLGKLPAGGGTLTISLPSNWQDDEGVVDALATAESKGWVFTYQTYEAEAGAASTFALRRIWVRKTQDEGGGYVAADGSRWLVEWCAGMIGADPQEHGYEPFRSVDAAVAYWELEHYVNPEEELLTEQ